MKDFTAGHISSDEGSSLIGAVQEHLGESGLTFHHGVSYRNLLVVKRQAAPFDATTSTQPPHDIPDESVADHWPSGAGSEVLIGLMEKSKPILAGHAVNQSRKE